MFNKKSSFLKKVSVGFYLSVFSLTVMAREASKPAATPTPAPGGYTFQSLLLNCLNKFAFYH
jgi:hypothetical protein